MPKFKRLPKSAKPFKFELEEDFTITPRFDREFWQNIGFVDFREFRYNGGSVHSMGAGLAEVLNGKIKFIKGGKNNGLTCHRDHSWAINSGAPHAHDILLGENYHRFDVTINPKDSWLDENQKEEFLKERAIIDRVFLSVLLDYVDTLTGLKKRLYKFFSYSMYYAVRANSIIRG